MSLITTNHRTCRSTKVICEIHVCFVFSLFKSPSCVSEPCVGDDHWDSRPPEGFDELIKRIKELEHYLETLSEFTRLLRN
jgi:hypothetical protein